MPEGAHPLPPEKGWKGEDFVDIDGQNWPLDVAAKWLDFPESDLRDLVRILELESAGVIRMSSFSRQGRQPRAYPADKLVMIVEAIRDLREIIAALRFICQVHASPDVCFFSFDAQPAEVGIIGFPPSTVTATLVSACSRVLRANVKIVCLHGLPDE